MMYVLQQGKMFKVISKQPFNETDHKYKYEIENTSTKEKVYALYWSKLKYPIVYDESCEDVCAEYNWIVNTCGYAVARINGAYTYMHRHIMETTAIANTVDHIDWVKTDNRLKNLRAATMSQQNSNRASRSDKLPPLPELQEEGVIEYPRHVRWDKTEKKFVIEKHPMLLREVQQGLRNKAMMSGTKSEKVGVVQKYQDILAKLDELNAQYAQFADNSLVEVRKANACEFNEIVKAMKIYDGTYTEEVCSTDTPTETIVIQPQRRVEKGRKNPSALPPDCGVTIEMIPSYVWYRPTSETRGDAFIIDRHPKLEKSTWMTTSSKKVSTMEKFLQLMDKYNELEMKN